MRTFIKNIVWSVAALLCGAMLYILLRPDSYVGKLFSNCRYVLDFQNSLRHISAGFLRYYLPDMLWALALGCCIQGVLVPKSAGVFVCSALPLLYGLLWELLQYRGVLMGTGDLLDVLMYFCGSLVSVIINLKEIRK